MYNPTPRLNLLPFWMIADRRVGRTGNDDLLGGYIDGLKEAREHGGARKGPGVVGKEEGDGGVGDGVEGWVGGEAAGGL